MYSIMEESNDKMRSWTFGDVTSSIVNQIAAVLELHLFAVNEHVEDC